MPQAIFDSGVLSATGFGPSRPLIPGVEPGGSRAGKSKPALLIRDMKTELLNIGGAATADISILSVALALSQELDMTPSQLLEVSSYVVSGPATANEWSAIMKEDFADLHRGTLWAPKRVGIHVTEAEGILSSYSVRLYLDYDVVDVPWMDWFIMWEQLDGVPNLSREY